MGMDRHVRFDEARRPAWAMVATRLKDAGIAVQLRMIDGQLAFPDETPADDWRELRVGSAGGMVTIRRDPDGVTCVIWGNADGATRELWEAVASAYAAESGGVVDS